MTDSQDEMLSQDRKDLFEIFKQTPAGDIRESISDKEGLNIEEQEKQDDYVVNKHIKRIKTYGLWLAAISFGALFLSLVVAVLVSFYEYTMHVLGEQGRVTSFLKLVWDTALVVMATLFVERTFGKK